MQYLLTEEEYSALKKLKIEHSEKKKKELQEFCIFAAMHIPASRHWDKDDKSPWGCIHSKEKNSGYCDQCPAQRICPEEHKGWSQ